MILRRVIAHFRRQEWTAIAIDFVIVVAGVFVGLQVNNWNENRAEQRRADALYAQLIDDLESERLGVDTATRYFSTAADYARSALAGFAAPDSISDNAFVIAAYQASQWYESASSRSTYNELVSTGAVRLIRNERARAKVIGYFEFDWTGNASMKLRPAYREKVRGVIPFPVQEAIIAACGDKDLISERTYFAELPAECALALPPEVAETTAAALRSAPGMAEALRFQLAENISKVATMTSVRKQLDALIQTVEE